MNVVFIPPPMAYSLPGYVSLGTLSIMEEILLIFLQGLVELLMQVFGSGFLDLFTWWWWDDDQKTTPVRGFVAGLLLFLAGCALGGLSLWLVPHGLLPWSWLRVANLFIGPLISAWISWRIACWRKIRSPQVEPQNHALGAGLACLGFVLVRFIWTIR